MEWRILALGCGEVEGAEDDLPCEIDGVPEFWIVQAEGDHILPELLYMCCMRSEGCKV